MRITDVLVRETKKERLRNVLRADARVTFLTPNNLPFLTV